MTQNTNPIFGQAYDFLKQSDTNSFDTMLNDNKIDITQTNMDGYSFIHAALESDNVNTLKHVINQFPEDSADEASRKDAVTTHALIHVVNPKLIHRQPVNAEMFQFFTDECVRLTRKSTNLRFPGDQTPKPSL